MGKILPIILALIGMAGGVGAGLALRPDPKQETTLPECSGTAVTEAGTAAPTSADSENSGDPDKEPQKDYVKLNNQFVVPVVNAGRVSALVVLSLSLELNTGGPELVYKMEPKIRDAFLQVLFDHANSGGFDGNFTAGRNMNLLRRALLEVARSILGTAVDNVLIVDVVRQDA